MASGSDGDVTNALIVDTLKSMQATLARHSEDFREIKTRIGILETQVGTLTVQYASLPNRIDRIEERLDRIDTRLGLIDA